MRKRRSLLAIGLTLGIVALICFALVRVAVPALQPTIEIRNEAGVPLSDVRIVLFSSSRQWTEHVPVIEAGKRVRFRRRVSDLFVSTLRFTLDGKASTWSEGGIACPGETYVLTVGRDGDVTSSYERLGPDGWHVEDR